MKSPCAFGNLYAYARNNPLAYTDPTGKVCTGQASQWSSGVCTLDTYNGKALTPDVMKNLPKDAQTGIDRLQNNMTKAFQAVLKAENDNPNASINVPTAHGNVNLPLSALASRMSIVSLNLSSAPDPSGQGAAARSDSQQNSINFYSAATTAPPGQRVTNWGQENLLLHESLHQFPTIGAGRDPSDPQVHNQDFAGAVAPLIGTGQYREFVPPGGGSDGQGPRTSPPDNDQQGGE